MFSRHRLSLIAVFWLLVCCCASASAVETNGNTESVVLDINNLLEYHGLKPFAAFYYPDYLRVSGDDIYVEHQYLGYMVTLEPGEQNEHMPYFQAVITLVRSYDNAVSVMDQYLRELDEYMERDFAHHTITTVINAEGEQFSTIPGRGYVAQGVVVADGPVQGLSFSEEFRNFVLPGNVDLRVVFRYPTAIQNNENMRACFEAILGSLTVFTDYYNMGGDTNLSELRIRKRPSE